MKLSSTTKIANTVLTTLFFASTAFSRDHSSMNGTWTLVPAKSDFAGQTVVQTGSVTIEDHEGNTNVSRRFVYKGTKEIFFYNDVTAREHNAAIQAGKDIKSKTTWDHDTLKVTTTDSGVTTVESYTLNADGSLVAIVLRPEQKPITLFFSRN